MRSRSLVRSFLALITAVATVGLAAVESNASGLLVPSTPGIPPLRITDHLVSVSVDNGIARTQLTQTFRNDTKQRLEATYIFPLPEGADLTNFQLSFNGKMVEGEVLPADQARDIYESIVRQMKDPGLIEFIGTRLLRMRVFPIEPESDTTIILKYQQVCTPLSNMQAYHYPLATRQTAGQAFGTVRFAIDLNAASPLKNIWSPTHAVEIVRDGEYGAKVAYEAQGGSLEDDFLLLYNTDNSDLGLSVVTNKKNEEQPGHFVMMLTPKQLWPDQDKQPQDVIFVLDTSGSMAGDKLAQAKKSLNYCIKLLDERDRFSVVRFSTGFDVLFDAVSDASDDHKKQATEWVDRFEAAGGTNIADTLRHVMGMKPGSGDEASRPFVVVFLTDGQGNRNPDEILAALERATGGTGDSRVEDTSTVRIFPFGVGHDVNTKLLDRLANDFTGRPTYVQPGENLELVLGDFFGIISQPVLTDLKLDLPGIGVTQRFPATLGDLYHGQQLTIAGRFDNELTGPVKLTARRGGKAVEYSWPSVSFASADDADYVETVWAGRKIAYLIDQIRLHGENNEMIAEIVALSTEHGIQTPYTSWLVNPEQREVLARTRRGGREDDFAFGGAGGGGALRSPDDTALRERLRSLDSLRDAASALPPAGGGGGFGGGGGGSGGGGGGSLFSGGDASIELSLDEAEKAATAEAGRAATIVAGYTARLRDADNAGEFQLNRNMLPSIKVNDIWYHRLGLFLVDGRVDDKTELIPIRFGGAAYFELVGNKALRPAMAKSKYIILKLTDTHAVAIVDDEDAAEEFTPQQREQIGLAKR